MLKSSRVTRTEPSTEPVTIDELRTHLRISVKDHDATLQGLITTARQQVEEGYLTKALLDQTVVEYFDRFADGMAVHWAPVDSVTSVQYIDADGDTQTLSTSIYELGHVHGRGVVRLKDSQVFPATQAHSDVVWVTYTAGYGGADDVPKSIRRAIVLLAGGLFTGSIPERTIGAVLCPYSDMRVI